MPKVKVSVDKESCVGCGVCVSLSNVFVFSADGKSSISEEYRKDKNIDNEGFVEDEETINKVKEIANMCPVRAIVVTEVSE